MKLLILGAKGMLGQALCRGTNAEVVGWDRSEIDIIDKNQVQEKISALAPDVIINAAAYNNVDKAEKEDRELAMKINGEAVGYLAEAAAEIGAIFVHFSSDYVFKGDNPSGYKEDDVPEPQSWYAKSKWEGEKHLLSLRGASEASDEAIPSLNPKSSARGGRNPKQILNSNFQNLNTKFQIPDTKYYLIRTSRLFGPAGVGEGAKKSFVDTMLKLGKEEGELNLIDEEISSPTYVVDLARATRELIESGASSGIYHRTNSGACTWYGWAKKIFELAGLSVKLNPVLAGKFPRPAVRPKYSKLLTTKLPPLRKWEEALEEYLKTL